jgi:outer membrane protein assembly factor BamB
MECHKELGWTAQEFQARLSQYLDGELRGAEAEDLDEHIKECAHCRETLSEMRGADRVVARSIEGTRASAGFVARVMAALSARAFSSRRSARRVPNPLLWAIAAIALLGLVALVLALSGAFSGGTTGRHRRLDLIVGASAVSDGPTTPPVWRARAHDQFVTSTLQEGDRITSSSTTWLDAKAGGGTIRRPDGLTLHLAPGCSLSTTAEATERSGIALAVGSLLITAPADAGAFTLTLPPSTRLETEAGRRRVYASVSRATTAHVLSGAAMLFGPSATHRLGARDSASAVGAGAWELTRNADGRTLDLSFAPLRFRPHPWPQLGGSARRDGRAPYAVSPDISVIARIPGASSVSGAVIAADRTAYVLAGPAPGLLVGIRDAKIVTSLRLEAPAVGAPAVDRDGRILFATRRGVYAYAPGDSPRAQPRALIEFGAAQLPVAGPTVTPGGRILVAYSRGLSSHGPDGTLLWKRDDVVSGVLPSVGPDGTVYVASLRGRLYALDGDTGRDLSGALAPVDEALLSYPVVSTDGTAYALTARRYLVWRKPSGSSGRVGLPHADYLFAPAIAEDGTVFVASANGSVYKLPAAPTAPPERPFFELGGSLVRGPLLDGRGPIHLWTTDGALLRLSPQGRADSKELATRDPAHAAVGADGQLIFGCSDGRVFGK